MTESSMIVVISPGYAASSRKLTELNMALGNCTTVLPVLAIDVENVPQELSNIFTFDLRDEARFDDVFAELAEFLKKSFSRVGNLYNVPSMPQNYTPRLEETQVLKNQLLNSDESSVTVVAIQGLAGIGKTVTASALAHDCEIRRTFPDGIIWVQAAQLRDTDDLIRYLAEVYELTPKQPYWENVKRILRDKKSLIIMDDVENANFVHTLARETERSRILLTTRDNSVAEELQSLGLQLEAMSQADALTLLRQISGSDDPLLTEIANLAGNLPLALQLAAIQLRDFGADEVLKRLRSVGGSDLLELLFQSSLERTSSRDRELFIALSTFPEDEGIRVNQVEELGRQIAPDLSSLEVREFLKNLERLGLITSAENGEIFHIHPLVRDYVHKNVDPEQLSRLQESTQSDEAIEDVNEVAFDAFISYSAKNRDIAEQIHSALIAAGFKIWYDQTKIHLGDDWAGMLQQGLESSKCIVLLMSPDSIRSDFIQREQDWAVTNGIPIIPVLVAGDFSDSMPEKLRSLSFVDLRSEQYQPGFQRLMDAITFYARWTETQRQAYINREHDVFLSYSRKDHDFVRRLQQTLQSNNLRVWIDASIYGYDFSLEIENAVKNSRCLVVVLSPEAVRSEWVKREIEIAQSNNIRIFPVMIERCDLPPRLRTIQYLDISTSDNEKQSQQLIEVIQEFLKELREREVLSNVHDKTEREVGRKLLVAGWNESPFSLKIGNVFSKDAMIDFVLTHTEMDMLAIVQVKKSQDELARVKQRAKQYAVGLQVSFVYIADMSSIIEIDLSQEKEIEVNSFPDPFALLNRSTSPIDPRKIADPHLPINLQALKANNNEAWTTVVEMYSPLIARSLRRYDLDSQVISELVQDTWITFRDKINQFELKDETTFYNYLRFIALNHERDFIRRERRSVDLVDIDEQSSYQAALDENELYTAIESFEDQALNRIDQNDIINQLLQQLTELQKQVFMRRTEGRSFKEIAQELKYSERTILNAWKNIRRIADKIISNTPGDQ